MYTMKKSLTIKTRFFIFSLLLLAFLPLLPKALGGQSEVIIGWGWNSILKDSTSNPPSGLGWVSLNCVGDFDYDSKLDYRCNDSNYGLTVGLSGALTDGASLPQYIRGCAWSDSYGWICFDKADGSYCPSVFPSDPNIALACGSLNDNGVAVQEITKNTTKYYILTNADPNTNSNARASVLSLADAGTGAVSRSYIGFPYDSTALATPAAGTNVTGCIGCPTTGSGKKCAACLLTNEGYSDPVKAPNPNILCVDCSNCTVKTRGGSCNVPGDISDPSSTVNTCLASSCSVCYSRPGVLLNYPKTCQDSGAYCTVNTNCTNTTLGCNYVNSKAELCGWGYNAYDSGSPLAWYTDIANPTQTWQYRIKLTVNSSKVAAVSYTKFPVYVNLKGLPASFLNHIKNDGSDIIVTDDAGITALSREIVLNAAGEPAELYFNSLSYLTNAADTDFYIYYGNSDANIVNDPLTWRPVYQAVYHMTENPINNPGAVLIDSKNGRNATPLNFYTAAALGFKDRGVGLNFGGGDEVVTLGNVSSLGNFTLEGWIKEDSACDYATTENGNCVFWSKDWSNWVFIKPDKEHIIFNGSAALQEFSTVTNLNEWIYVTVVRSGPTYSYYRNGVFVGSQTMDTNTVNFSNTFLGDFLYDPDYKLTGLMDEVRISSFAYDQAWITTQYNNMNDPTSFFTIGDPTSKASASGFSGLGWIAFNPALYGQATPYTQAEQGNVFSGQDITGLLPPPLGKYNAAYLIDAGGQIARWTTSLSDGTRATIGGITFPTLINDRTTASSSLATIDLEGLYTKLGATVNNKYGSEVKTPASIESVFPGPLANKVYYFTFPQTLNSVATISNGSGTVSGAGIIYIKGNLTITKDISYASAPVTRLGHIPSVVWIVEGDVIIDPTVKKVVGTFIVLGDGNPTVCPATTNPISLGCGRFSTGDDSANRLPLDIYGNVIARQILLQRSYNEGDNAAERFIADGRLQTNTPAGLGDLGKNLPRFTSAF